MSLFYHRVLGISHCPVVPVQFYADMLIPPCLELICFRFCTIRSSVVAEEEYHSSLFDVTLLGFYFIININTNMISMHFALTSSGYVLLYLSWRFINWHFVQFLMLIEKRSKRLHHKSTSATPDDAFLDGYNCFDL